MEFWKIKFDWWNANLKDEHIYLLYYEFRDVEHFRDYPR